MASKKAATKPAAVAVSPQMAWGAKVNQALGEMIRIWRGEHPDEMNLPFEASCIMYDADLLRVGAMKAEQEWRDVRQSNA